MKTPADPWLLPGVIGNPDINAIRRDPINARLWAMSQPERGDSRVLAVYRLAEREIRRAKEGKETPALPPPPKREGRR